MSEYTELRDEIVTVMDSVTEYARAVTRHGDALAEQVGKLWKDQAELRDELHAVANRVESLTRAVMADPAEVAAAIVNDANRSTLREVDGRQT